MCVGWLEGQGSGNSRGRNYERLERHEINSRGVELRMKRMARMGGEDGNIREAAGRYGERDCGKGRKRNRMVGQ